MVTTQSACEALVTEVDDCLAVGVVDLNTGMLMGVHHTVPHFTQTYLDAVAAAAVDMFRGRNVRRVEELLSRRRGEEVKDSFEEIFISSTQVLHFMTLLREKSAVVVMVTRKSADREATWSSVRAALGALEATLP